MAGAIRVERLSKETWDSLVLSFRDTSYRQLSSYAAAAARRVGAISELNGLFEGQSLIGLADVRVKMLPLTPFGIGYLSHAPIIQTGSTFSAGKFTRCLDALRQEYVERRHILLRVIPALVGGQFQEEQIAALVTCGFKLFVRQKSRETFILNLNRPLDCIRRDADLHWRRNLTKSEKAAIQITQTIEVNDFDHFERIFLELTKRKEFQANQDVRFFRNVQVDLPSDQKLVLHLAWNGEELVAGHLGSFLGDTAIYLLGASSAKGRDLRASYLLHWRVIEYAKKIGSIYYDLGGIDQERNPGVFRFKQGLNGRAVTDVGPYECAPGRLSSGILHFLETARNAVRL